MKTNDFGKIGIIFILLVKNSNVLYKTFYKKV